ncbi:hypothetical protein VDIAB_250331 [Vibrio diabolicus]|nr:hypothetical protein VDIAB_250331 [Vibrio diabolicus]
MKSITPLIFYFLLQIKVSKDKPKSVFVLRGKLASYCIFRLFSPI